MKKTGFIPEQTQDFYPTPGTLAACMYYTGLDPMTGEAVYVAKTPADRRMRRALLHFDKPENRSLVLSALTAAGRSDAAASLLGKSGYKKR
jgi:radical SAM superfamily enzyme YgiQ (UPF0313 family)